MKPMTTVISGLMMTFLVSTVFANDVDYQQRNRLDRNGDRIERHMDRKGERINARLDRRSAIAAAHGHHQRAAYLDRKGDRIDRNMDRRGHHIDAGLDRRAARIEHRFERRHQ